MSTTLDGVVQERFWSYVDRSGGPDTCWPWTGPQNGHGYGRFYIPSSREHRALSAHKVAYELAVGPVPDGLDLDHLCRNRTCANHAHLEPVTRSENTRRGLLSALHTVCPNGHQAIGENIAHRRDNGRRYCRACSREKNRIQSAKRRAA